MQPLEHATAKGAATHRHKLAIIVLIAAVLLAGVLVWWCVDSAKFSNSGWFALSLILRD